ncbi:MAG: hypothetical protein IJW48_01320 [Clostridia bacterium]|nr:hypothetical protein [Clostridia bacterium]
MTKTKKRLAVLAAVLLGIIFAYILLSSAPRLNNFDGDNPMMKEGELPILIAHGGGNKEFPDNTLEAFYNAYSVDSRVMMETDVSITKDGVVILSHDTTIDRKTNATGAIAEWSYTDLINQRVDFGYTNPTEDGVLWGEREHFNVDGENKYPTDVPGYPEGLPGRDSEVFLATTLEELITDFPSNRINVEIKQSGELGLECLTEVLRIVKKHDAWERVVLASFHSEIYDEFLSLKKSGDVPESFMFSPGTEGAAKYFVLYLLGLDAFFTDEMCVFQLPMEELGLNLATSGLVNNAHRHNLAVHYWTIDDEDDMRALIEIGADGIMTNYPSRLKDVYKEYGN